MINLVHKLKSRTNIRGQSIAELGPALLIVVTCVLFPLLELLSLAYGIASVLFITETVAHSERGLPPNCEEATQLLAAKASRLSTSTVARLAKLEAVGGLRDSGIDFYFDFVKPNGSIIRYDVNKLQRESTLTLSSLVRQDKCKVKFTVRSSYRVWPLINFSQAGQRLDHTPALGTGVPVQLEISTPLSHLEWLKSARLTASHAISGNDSRQLMKASHRCHSMAISL